MKNTKLIFGILTLFLCQLVFSIAQDRPTVKIASFNILRLGQEGYDVKKDWEKVVTVLTQFDVIVLLEVMDVEKLDSLVDLIEDRENKNWVYTCSKPIGRGSKYKERYAIIWRDEDADRVSAGPEGLYPDPLDSLEREPYFATFKSDSFDYTIICMHSHYGKNWPKYPKIEAKLLDNVYNYVQDLSEENDVILMGDFNLHANYAEWNQLKSIPNMIHVFPGNFKTSLGILNKRTSAFDNIWLQSNFCTEYADTSGSYDFDDELYPGVTDPHRIARDEISDHVPIWVMFYTDIDDD